MSFTPLLRAEGLKLKGSRMLPAVVLLSAAPLLAHAIFQVSYRGSVPMNVNPWVALAHSTLSMWAFLMLPLVAAMVALALVLVEHENQQWKLLLCHPVERSRLFLAKFVTGVGVMALVVAFLVLLSLLAAACTGLLTPDSAYLHAPFPVLRLLCILGLGALGGVLIFTLNLWIGLRWPRLAVVMGVNAAGGMLAPFLISGPKYHVPGGFLFPWTLPSRLLQGSSLLMPMLVTLALLVLFAVLGRRHLVRMTL